MRHLLFLLLVCISTNSFAQFKIHPDSSFYSFLDSFSYYYQDDGTEGGLYNHVRRDIMTWGTRLAPDGKMSKATQAMMNYSRSYIPPPAPIPSAPTTTITFPSTHPFDPSLAELGTSSTVSGTNAGRGMGQIQRIAFHPNYDGTNNRTLYAGSHYGGLFRSDDAGGTWYNYNTDRGLPMTSIGGVAVSRGFFDWLKFNKEEYLR